MLTSAGFERGEEKAPRSLQCVQRAKARKEDEGQTYFHFVPGEGQRVTNSCTAHQRLLRTGTSCPSLSTGAFGAMMEGEGGLCVLLWDQVREKAKKMGS